MTRSTPLLLASLLLLATGSLRAEVRLLTGSSDNTAHARDSFLLDVSGDGRFALFTTGVPSNGSPSPGITQGGLHRRNLGTGELTYVGGGIAGGPDTSGSATEASISDDGSKLAWCAGNLIYWRDQSAGQTRLLTPGADGFCRGAKISADGRYVAFVSAARNLVSQTALLPASGRAAVYLYDSGTGQLALVSLSSTGTALTTGVGTGAGAISDFDFSADGRFVFFATDAPNAHPDRASASNQAYFWLYRRELATGNVVIVHRNAENQIPVGNFNGPRCSADGSRVLFSLLYVSGPAMVPGYVPFFATDLYVKDLSGGTIWRVTQTTDNAAPNGQLASDVQINPAGTLACFGSSGSNFVAENTDPTGGAGQVDLFRVDLNSGGGTSTTLLSKAAVGSSNVAVFNGPFVSSSYIAFNTSSLLSMLGTGVDNSIFKHGVAVGTFSFGGLDPASAQPLVNVSTRARVESGDDVVIGGFVIAGTGTKRVLVRCLGPSLAAFGVGGVLTDPNLEVKNASQQTIATNDDWRANEAAVLASGFAPTDNRECAVVLDLPAGAYTAIVRGAGGAQGVAIIEVYDLATSGSGARLVNLSTRAKVQTGDNVVIGGVVTQGTQARRLLVRAVGPSLAAFGVPNVLANPTLEINAGATQIATNDNWKDQPGMAAIAASGFAPTDDREAAVILERPAGSCTAIVRGAGGTTGVAIIEVYELP